MTSTQNDLRFPVIQSFSVNNYQLYPGDDGEGFTYSVKPGVNIVVGVNGLGKTTLLNLLLRLVAGPHQIQALTGLGMGAREEGKSGSRFFSSRVKDAAVSASATATIGFGQRRITVTRKLSTLDITALKVDDLIVNGPTAKAFEDQYKSAVIELSGVRQYYDYLLLVQFIFFFLEDRQALIWDEDAQSEILRVLYYDPDQQIAYRSHYNKISELDSEIRNTQNVLNRHQKKIQEELLKRADQKTILEEKTLRKTLSELRKGIEENEESAEAINVDRLQYRDQLENLKVEREDKIAKARAANEAYLRVEFAGAENTALYAVTSLVVARGCIVCGSQHERAKQVVQHRLDKHECPLCEAGESEREFKSASGDSASLAKAAQELDFAASEVNNSVKRLEELVAEQTKKYEDCMHVLQQQRRQHEEIRLNLQVLGFGLPSNDEDLQKLQEKLMSVKELIDSAKEDKANAESALASIIETGEKKVAEVAAAIAIRFEEYIRGFMAETCVLQYDVKEKRIGQGPATQKFRFPRFSVRVTSGVFKEAASNRSTQQDVSESQREFIDLAFRMSLIAEITARSAAMLVVETPEASLDSVFVPRAGNMVRRFLESSTDRQNVLIASTNLNREAMIPALFGIIPESEAMQLAAQGKQQEFEQRARDALPRSGRIDRIVNLLDLAAENAALAKYGEEYAAEFQRAVYPPWEDYDRDRELV